MQSMFFFCFFFLFFLWLTQRAYIMMHTNFLQTLLKLLCSIFLIVDINTYCFYQHFLMQPLYDPYQPADFLFSFPCPVPLHPKGVDLKSARSDPKGNIMSSPDLISQSAFCVHFLDAEIQSSETWLQSLFHTLPTPQEPLESWLTGYPRLGHRTSSPNWIQYSKHLAPLSLHLRPLISLFSLHSCKVSGFFN